jgi:hypothetical protein
VKLVSRDAGGGVQVTEIQRQSAEADVEAPLIAELAGMHRHHMVKPL